MGSDWENDPWRIHAKYAEVFKLTEQGKRIEALVAQQPDEVTVKSPDEVNQENLSYRDVQPESPSEPAQPQAPPFLKQLRNWPPPPSEKQKEVIPVANPYRKQPVPLKPDDNVTDYGRPPLEL